MFKSKWSFVPVVFSLVLLLALAGCTHRMLDFTVVSSKNVDLSLMNTYVRGTERVEGKDTAYIILFIPTGTPNMKEACDRAIEKVPGAVALVDGVIISKGYWFILGASSSWVVEGTPLIDPALAEGPEPESNYMVAYYDKSIDDTKLIYVTKAEYETVKTAIHDRNARQIEEMLAIR